MLQKYLAKVKDLMEKVDISEVRYVPRADILSKLASTKMGGSNKSLIQEVLKTPSIADLISVVTMYENPKWMTPIMRYLMNGALPSDLVEAKRLSKEASYYIIIGGQLYKRSLSQPLLKCLAPEQVNSVLEEVHEGSCGHHPKGKILALKILRAGYYWPMMTKSSVEFVKKCPKYQQHANFHSALEEELSAIMSPWPFSKWGIDLLGPFPLAPEQVKYLIVAIDYFTKQIEAKPLFSIMAAQARKFVWRNIFTRFGIPESLITDNGTQFADRKFRDFLSSYKV